MADTIVVVEDNQMNANLLEQVLGIAGYRVVTSPDGEDLVAQVSGCGAGLVLMDIQLPHLSGIELLHLLKAEAATAAIPVLAITACADSESVAEFLRVGFDQVITKPVSIHQLLYDVACYCPIRTEIGATPGGRTA
jgi:two-component system, cell cycle response regulator DivK